jgi:hypothetical protein
VAAQGAQHRLVEDLGDQAHVFVDEDAAALADRDARGLLAAVLQRVQPVVGEFGNFLAWRPDAEDATGVFGSVVLGVQVMAEPAVALQHMPQSRLAASVLAHSGRRSDHVD